MPEETPETTNAVLKEKIEGLVKLTDVEFQHMKTGINDIKSMMQGFATRIEMEHMKKDFSDSILRIEEGFKKHNADDVASFAQLNGVQKEVRDVMLKWIGGLAVAIFVLPFIAPLILSKLFNVE